VILLAERERDERGECSNPPPAGEIPLSPVALLL